MRQYIFPARLLRVIDGDTVIMTMKLREPEDLGFHIWTDTIIANQSIRVQGVNAPELFSGTNREAGSAAREFVVDWVISAETSATDPQWPFTVETFKSKTSFNRYIGHVICTDTGESLADALIAAGHGVAS